MSEKIVVVQLVRMLPRALNFLGKFARLTPGLLLESIEHFGVGERLTLDLAEHALSVVHHGTVATCFNHCLAQCGCFGLLEPLHRQTDGPSMRKYNLSREPVEVSNKDIPTGSRLS